MIDKIKSKKGEKMENKTKVAVVTGGSSGIGLCVAERLLKSGVKVYEISRHKKEGSPFFHITADVSDENEVKNAVDEILRAEGYIDLLVNCAGFGISGAVEFTKTDDAKRQFDVNFFGVVNMCAAVIPAMRKQKSGKIINISSVAAAVPIPFQTFYSASKAAINSYTMALSNELKPFGIKVCAVMPGDIKTGFTASRKKNIMGDDVYGGRISRSVSLMEKDESNGMTPEKVGAYIVKISEKKNIKPLYTIRADYKAAVILSKILPARMLNYIVGKIYAK